MPRAKQYTISVEQLVSGDVVMQAKGTVKEAKQLAKHLREDQGCFVEQIGPFPKLNWIALKVGACRRKRRRR
jgi:hypothetical protein